MGSVLAAVSIARVEASNLLPPPLSILPPACSLESGPSQPPPAGAALADCFGQPDNNGTDRNLLNLDFYCGGAEIMLSFPPSPVILADL